MKHLAKRFRIIATWVALVSLGIQGNAWADDDDIENIFIFGDSLSDPGNVYILENFATSQPPYLMPIPDYPYDIAGFQFTNGKTWAQKFARNLELRRSGKAALAKPGKFTNYAHGGARARYVGDMRSGPEQIMSYMQTFPGGADDEALYVIQFGGNDIRDALDPTADPVAIIGMAVMSEIDMILQLYQQGARNFLVANVPDLSLSPAIRQSDAMSPYPEGTIINATNELVVAYNFELENALVGVEQMFEDISIKRLDFFGIVNDISTSPGIYGINNTEDSCINFAVIVDQVCDRPNKYLFWDAIHPTKKVHRIIGDQATELYDD